MSSSSAIFVTRCTIAGLPRTTSELLLSTGSTDSAVLNDDEEEPADLTMFPPKLHEEEGETVISGRMLNNIVKEYRVALEAGKGNYRDPEFYDQTNKQLTWMENNMERLARIFGGQARR